MLKDKHQHYYVNLIISDYFKDDAIDKEIDFSKAFKWSFSASSYIHWDIEEDIKDFSSFPRRINTLKKIENYIQRKVKKNKHSLKILTF